jgi:drug/metabolite transporter (DMT)-like permease
VISKYFDEPPYSDRLALMQRPADPLHTLPSTTDRPARLKGIGLICVALFCFALLDTTAKWLSGRMDTIQVIWARFAVHFVLSFLFVNPWTVTGLVRTRRPWLQVGRSALLLGSTAFNFIALRFLQLDQTASIMFTTPFLVAAFAGPLLGEWLDWRRWTAIIIGFSGILLVTRPGAGGIHPAAIFSVMAAVCFALYSITTRILASYDRNETTSFYSSIVGLLGASIPVAWFWTSPSDLSTMAGMVAIGAFGWIGHWLLIVAHRYAPAPVLAPFTYSQIVWMSLTGFIVFGHRPSAWTLAGAGVVIASGLYLLGRERRRN